MVPLQYLPLHFTHDTKGNCLTPFFPLVSAEALGKLMPVVDISRHSLVVDIGLGFGASALQLAVTWHFNYIVMSCVFKNFNSINKALAKTVHYGVSLSTLLHS
jgi:tRNA G46 methylase TrmB